MIKVNSLIVGQGLAGTLMAFMLQRKGLSVMVIDEDKKMTASKIAAGMFSVISGKRKTVNDQMFLKQQFAIDIYKEAEQLLGKKFLHCENIIHLFLNEDEKSETVKRMEDEKFNRYIIAPPKKTENVFDGFGAIEIKNSGWLNCELFLDTYRNYLVSTNSFLIDDFKYTDLQIAEDSIQYKNIEAVNIIFCEGYMARNNPFFQNENIIPCKGDIITLKQKNTRNKKIIKTNSCYVIPVNENMMKAGSTFHWKNDDEQLRLSDKKELKNNADAILRDDYEIINHQTAIRPTTFNREVIAKQHLKYKNMFMLNGLGTKGVIQAPYWADYILKMIK